MHTNRYMYHGHWIPFRRSNLLSYQAMSSTRTKSQICTAAPISLFVQCQVSFHYPSINSPINLYIHTHIMYQIVWVAKLQKSNCSNNRVETLFSCYRISFCAYFCDFFSVFKLQRKLNFSWFFMKKDGRKFWTREGFLYYKLVIPCLTRQSTSFNWTVIIFYHFFIFIQTYTNTHRYITEMNKLLKSGAYVVAEKLWKMKKNKSNEKWNKPCWKRRIKAHIEEWRKKRSQ